MDPTQPGGQQPQQPDGQGGQPQPWGGPPPFQPQPPSGQPHPAYQPYQQFPPYPVPPVTPPVNGFAVASLVTGIVCCLPPLGLFLGLTAFSQIKKKRHRGRGLAVAGTVLSAVSTLVVALAIMSGAAGDAWTGFRKSMDEASRYRAVADLNRGDCFNLPAGGAPEEGDSTEEVEVVDCEEPHEAEVSGTFELTGYRPYPGDSVLEPVVERRCEDIEFAYAMDFWEVPDTVEPSYLVPTPDSWKLGDREVTCAFSTVEGDRITGSVRSDATSLNQDQKVYLKAEGEVFRAGFEEPEKRFSEAPDSNRAWAKVMSTAYADMGRMLRKHTWPTDAAKSVTKRTDEFDRVSAEWDKATRAEDEATFLEHVSRAAGALDSGTEISIREALDLQTTRPDWVAGP
ncbi:DUF4190 domain-containing protein [Streptomyces sp. NPDC004726]